MKKEKKGNKTKKIDLMRFVKMNEQTILSLYEVYEINGGKTKINSCGTIIVTEAPLLMAN